MLRVTFFCEKKSEELGHSVKPVLKNQNRLVWRGELIKAGIRVFLLHLVFNVVRQVAEEIHACFLLKLRDRQGILLQVCV